MRIYFFILLVCGYAQARVRLDPLVDTKQGLIKGLKAEDGDYSMFLGIPYATVDKSNAFGPSSSHPKFDTVLEAYDDSAICPQVEEFNNSVVGTLDCLHLNVYVPNTASSRNKLPVIVWIYGGGFSIGFAGRYIYGPKFLVRHDVVLVTINYRVGPYGFLCLDIPEVPGNQGLKDQLLALQWVKDNIAAFGGDINKITLMGESAGAASVESHILSKNEKLFNKAIMQSGSMLSPWAVVPSDKTVPLRIAGKLGFDTNDVYEALSFLSNADTKLVIGASSDLSINYRTCVEKTFENVEAFISEDPKFLYIPKAKSIPILTGHNNDESLADYINKSPDFFKNLNVVHDNLDIVFDFGDDVKEMKDIVRHFYMGDKEMNQEVRRDVIDFSSDYNFNYPVYRSLKKLLHYEAPSIYHYVFSYSGGRNFVKKRNNITEGGASHADEISYLFDVSINKEEPSQNDQLIIDRITTLWTNFAKYGNPTPETTELLPVKWSPITKDVLYYLNIDTELQLGTRPFHARNTFWDLFIKTNYQNLKVYGNNL